MTGAQPPSKRRDWVRPSFVQSECGSRTKLRVLEANMLMMKHMYEYNAMPWSGR